MKEFKQICKGLWRCTQFILGCVGSLAVGLGPAIVAGETGNFYWLFLYTPHVLFFMYGMGSDLELG